jgi:hypothetical protein
VKLALNGYNRHRFDCTCCQSPEPIDSDSMVDESFFEQPQFGSWREIVAMADFFPTADGIFSPHRAVSD